MSPVTPLPDYVLQEKESARQLAKNYVDLTYQILENHYKEVTSSEGLQKIYGRQLSSMIDICEGVVQNAYDAYQKGNLSEDQAKTQALGYIHQFRYNEQNGYIWVMTNEPPIPSMLTHPYLPELMHRDLGSPDFNTVQGKNTNLFAEMVSVSNAQGEGFVHYLWPKPGTNMSSQNYPKISYVRLFKPWGWILGTGVYVDDAIADAKQETLEEIKNLRYQNGNGYFWINDDTLPYPKMLMHPLYPDLEGKSLEFERFNIPTENGKHNFFALMTQKSMSDGSAFFDYSLPLTLEASLSKNELHISYTKYFKPWNWVIGTGYLMSDIEKKAENGMHMALQKNSLHLFKIFLLIFATLLGILASIFFIFRPAHSSKNSA